MNFEFAPFHAKVCRLVLVPETAAEKYQLDALSNELAEHGVEYKWELRPSLQRSPPFDRVASLHIFATATLPPSKDVAV